MFCDHMIYGQYRLRQILAETDCNASKVSRFEISYIRITP